MEYAHSGRQPHEPYCGHCGYSLVGLVDSSKCPECGRPIIEVLQREGMKTAGRRYTSAAEVFGIPLVQIASGPYGNERIGRAKAIIPRTGQFSFRLLLVDQPSQCILRHRLSRGC